MQKMIRVLAVVAVILVALSILALLISIPLQRVLATKLLSMPADIAHYLPMFPWAPFLRCLLLLGCVILLAVCAGKKGIILPEILLLVVMLIVIPLTGSVLPTMLQTLLAGHKGDIYVIAFSCVTTISNYCNVFATLGNSLALVVCGMNMVHKKMSRQLDKLCA